MHSIDGGCPVPHTSAGAAISRPDADAESKTVWRLSGLQACLNQITGHILTSEHLHEKLAHFPQIKTMK